MILESIGSADEGGIASAQNPLLVALYRAQSGSLSAQLRDVTLAPGETVFEEGVVPRTVVFPDGALLSSLAAMSDGRMVEVASMGRGDAVGALSCLTSSPETNRTVVRIGGPAKIIAGPSLRAAAESNEEVRRVLLQTIRDCAVRVEHELACSALHDVTARLAKWLLLTCDRTGESRLTLTQDDMATTLGVQRTTLNASALHLKSAGAIRYSRGVVQVLDSEQLEAQACECYAHAVRGFEPEDIGRRKKVA